MTKIEKWVEKLEENLISFLIGMMTLLTFSNVVARYAFNKNIFFALELTVFMFAWLVLLGASYAVKKNSHLGVDVLINMMDSIWRRRIALFVAATCILYSALLLKGSWDYWAPFANLSPTEGRWLPTGFAEKFHKMGWYETQDIPVPFFLTWLEDVFNGGNVYEKLPKVVPYFVMPLSMTLLLFRFLQVFLSIWRGKIDRLIVSHEAEDDVEMAAKLVAQQDKGI